MLMLDVHAVINDFLFGSQLLDEVWRNDHVLLSLTLLAWVYVFYIGRYVPLLFLSILLFFFNLFFLLFQLPRFDFDIETPILFLLHIVTLAVGLWGLVRSIKEIKTMVLDNERVIESYNYIVEKGAGHEQWVLGKTEELILNTRMPGVKTEQKDVSIGLFSEKRKFLVVTHARYKQYTLFMGARSYGEILDAGWFLTVSPNFLMRKISKHATGNPNALSQHLDFFSQQDIKAFKEVCHQQFKTALKMLSEELQLDPSGVDDPRGYLNVW